MGRRTPILVEVELGQIDLRVRELHRHDGVVVALTATEADLVAWLAAAGGADVSRSELLREVWGYREGVRTRTIDTTMRRLRAKIERVPGSPRHLQTVKGVGYRFAPLDEAAETARVGAGLDRFVGRRDELALLDRLEAGGDRLITLWGPGGTGKTRLARQWLQGRHALAVELAAVEGADDVVGAVCLAAGLAHAPVERLLLALERRGVRWLLLDDVQHLLPDIAPLVRALSVGQLRVLVTSRLRLALDGETPVAVPPLPAADGLALLRARAPGALADHDDAELSGLVAALDGLPLALELAARQADLLGARELLERLPAVLDDDVLDSCLRWSWAVLPDAERDALRALSTFVSDFDVAAAEAAVGAADALARLQVLRDHSWLQVRGRVGGQRRLGMLAPQRAMVQRHAGADPDAALRLARHFARLDSEAERDRRSRGDGRRIAVLTADRWNLLAAVSAARAQDEVEVAARCALVAHEATRLEAPMPGLEAHLVALDGAVADPLVAGRLALARASMARRRGDLDAALARGEAVAAVATGLVRAEALLFVAVALMERGRTDDARVAFRAAADAAQAPRMRGLVAMNHGNLHLHSGELDRATERLAHAVALFRRHGYRRLAALAQANLASVQHELGALDAAEEGYREALSLHRSLGNRRDAALVEANRGMLCLDRGQVDDARDHLRLAMAAHRRLGQPRGEALSLIFLAEAERLRGRTAEALARSLEARELADQVGLRAVAAVADSLVAELDRAPDAVPRLEAAVEALLDHGAALDAEVARCRLGRLHLVEGRAGAAHRCLDQARAVREARGIGPRSELGRAVGELSRALGAPPGGGDATVPA